MSVGATETGRCVYVGNIPKAATEEELRKFFGEGKEITSFSFRLEDCTYCPTKIAFIKFADKNDENQAYRLNQTLFQGKRLFIACADSDRYFMPRYAVVLKNLNQYITEEDIYDHFKNIGQIECVQKPNSKHGYVSFERSESVQRALASKNRNLKGIEFEIDTVKRNICMLLEKQKLLIYPTIKEKCEALGLCYDEEAEMENKLLVTNIPRQASEEEILEYLGKFGKIIDWEMQKSPISVLTNIGYVTYMSPSTARFVYLYEPHYFQGVVLDIYNQRISYQTNPCPYSVVLKRTNIYLTNDEIYQAMNDCGRVVYIHRVDSIRYCTIVRFRLPHVTPAALKIKNIADENVYVTKYSEANYMSPIPPIPEAMPKSSLRIYKEAALRKMIEQEDRAEMTRPRMVPNMNYRSPNPVYYRNEVKILNYPLGSGMAQFREFFKSYANVINFREEDGIGYLSFDTRLEARRVSSMSQQFMDGKRLLLHMANQNLYIDPALCVNVVKLSDIVSDEEIYDRFNAIGNVKFVLRESANKAIVCMEHNRLLEAALRVTSVARLDVFVTRVQPPPGNMNINPNDPMKVANGSIMGPTGPMMGPTGPMIGPNRPMAGPVGPVMGPGGPMRGPGGPMMGPSGPNAGPGGPPLGGPGGRMLGPNGPMMGPGGPMMGPNGPMMGPNGPMMGPNGPMVGPNGPMMGPNGPMMGPNGPMMGPNGTPAIPNITPAMHKLMQIVEKEMIKVQAFISLPMPEQFNLVHGIVNQFINVPPFLTMPIDQKISFLINGQNGFACSYAFTLFTYPQQKQLLSLIQADYVNTVSGNNSAKQPPGPNPVGTNKTESMAPWQVKLENQSNKSMVDLDKSKSAHDRISAQDRFEKAERMLNSHSKNQRARGDRIPPAPAPPKFTLNRSPSPDRRRSRIRSRSPNHSSTPNNSHARREKLSPVSAALFSSPMRYERSLSKSPNRYRSRSRSPRGTNRSADNQILRRSRSKSIDRTGSPFDNDSFANKASRYISDKDQDAAASAIFVTHLPPTTTEEDIAELFGKYGQIVGVSIPAQLSRTKRAFVKFDTFDQALKSLDMHLKQYRGYLIRVSSVDKHYKERPGFAVNIAVHGAYDELAIYDTFKTCGDIEYLWTRANANSTVYCAIDFKHRESVRAALETSKLITGVRCKVTAVV